MVPASASLFHAFLATPAHMLPVLLLFTQNPAAAAVVFETRGDFIDAEDSGTPSIPLIRLVRLDD